MGQELGVLAERCPAFFDSWGSTSPARVRVGADALSPAQVLRQLFSPVASEVTGETAGVAEAFPALGASVRLLSGVAFERKSKARALTTPLTAIRAGMEFSGRLDEASVSYEAGSQNIPQTFVSFFSWLLSFLGNRIWGPAQGLPIQRM